ncbi:MAG: large subunit ribosomal protein [Chloroflexota bacterium]|jgi:large subunit ribosomal protein L21|nr:large subunit ribosomal protein [Chloroflexota bacterium]
MYAVIETGGKQYRVELGSEFAVERLEGTPGDTINFDRVLLVADGDKANVGTPVVDDALVTASLVRHDRGEKVIVFKYRPKARHRAKNGHRQEQTIIRIADITLGGRSAASEAEVEQKEASKAKAKAAAEAEKKATADQALAAKLEKDAKAAAKAKDEAKAEKATEAKATAKVKPEPKAKAAPKSKPKAEAGSKSSAAKPAAKKTDTAPAKKPRAKKDE